MWRVTRLRSSCSVHTRGDHSGQAQQHEQQELLERLVMGIVTDFTGSPLTSIHNMLRMAFSDGQHPYRHTEQQLETFLAKVSPSNQGVRLLDYNCVQLVMQGKLTCRDGLYQRVKVPAK